MPTREEVQALLDRVQNATESDFDIDHDIALAFGTSWIANPVGEVAYLSYTSSIDAMIDLIEKELPGWHIAMGTVGELAIPWACITEPVDPCRDFTGNAPTVPLALAEAFLSAKLSQMQEPTHAD